MAGGAVRERFGTLPDGRIVDSVTLTNDRGMTVRIVAFGAAIQALTVPDREGRPADVALGFPDLEAYLTQSEYIGVTVGRVANRIALGRFALDGSTCQVPVNNGANSLHGGTPGFDKMLWDVVEVRSGPAPSVTLGHVSPDGDQGFPGELTATAVYTLDQQTNTLSVEYRAATDRPTIVNLTSHAYWNLAGEGAEQGAMGHLLTIPGDHYLPTDPGAIPTGEFRPVAGTPFDFRTPAAVGTRVRDSSDEQIRLGKGYDHNWVIAREPSSGPRLLARVEEPHSGRVMEVHSNQPGIQFYSGNFLDGSTAGKAGRLYRQGDAVVLEPQMFPDTPNRPEFGSVRLEPGDTYRNLIQFRFSAEPLPARR
ncbi:aldose epimerase family protein [Allosphingosinicella sp.]|jgi:aldose 1-epimerase|uniref:aldose epimerase family protein n=1 Tax=Allosphingosinicella sp. TaxID=2823234 RepID=UPI002EEC8CF1